MPSDDEERHLNMLHGITGMPLQAFEGDCFFSFDLDAIAKFVFDAITMRFRWYWK